MLYISLYILVSSLSHEYRHPINPRKMSGNFNQAMPSPSPGLFVVAFFAYASGQATSPASHWARPGLRNHFGPFWPQDAPRLHHTSETMIQAVRVLVQAHNFRSPRPIQNPGVLFFLTIPTFYLGVAGKRSILNPITWTERNSFPSFADLVLIQLYNLRFPEIGVPPNHPFQWDFPL